MECMDAPSRAVGTLTTDSLKPFDAVMRERSSHRGKRRRSESGGDAHECEGEGRGSNATKRVNSDGDDTWPMLHVLAAQPGKLVLLLPVHAPVHSGGMHAASGGDRDDSQMRSHAPLSSVAAPPLAMSQHASLPAHLFDTQADAITPTNLERGGESVGVYFSPYSGAPSATADVSFFSGRPRTTGTRTPARRRVTSRRAVVASPGTVAFRDPTSADVLSTPTRATDPLSCVAAASPDFNSSLHPHLRSPEPSDLSRAALLAQHSDSLPLVASSHLYMTPPTSLAFATSVRGLSYASSIATTMVAAPLTTTSSAVPTVPLLPPQRSVALHD